MVMNKDGQVTVETLIILSASTLMLLLFVVFAWDQMVVSFEAQQKDLAKGAVLRLADEIDDAYYLGIGTKKTFELVLPESVSLEKSEMQGRTLILHVAGNDVIASTAVDVNGKWPDVTGSTTFVIEVGEDMVQVMVNPE